MRKIIGCFIVLFLAPTSPAKPWYKDWRALTVVGISLGSSVAATHEAHACRQRFGPAPCEGGYGEFAAREGLRFGMSAGMSALSLWGRHEGFKEWPVWAAGFGAYSTYVAVHQTTIGCPVGEHFLYGTKKTCVMDAEYWGKP